MYSSFCGSPMRLIFFLLAARRVTELTLALDGLRRDSRSWRRFFFKAKGREGRLKYITRRKMVTAVVLLLIGRKRGCYSEKK